MKCILFNFGSLQLYKADSITDIFLGIYKTSIFLNMPEWMLYYTVQLVIVLYYVADTENHILIDKRTFSELTSPFSKYPMALIMV